MKKMEPNEGSSLTALFIKIVMELKPAISAGVELTKHKKTTPIMNSRGRLVIFGRVKKGPL